MLTAEQKKALGDMLVKRLMTGEDLATATRFVKNYFAKRAARETAQALRKPKRAAKRAAKQKPKRATKRARDPEAKRALARGARGRFVAAT